MTKTMTNTYVVIFFCRLHFSLAVIVPDIYIYRVHCNAVVADSFDNSIGRHFVSFLTCISCFYIYLVKYFHLNEKFILLKDSSDRNSLSKLGSD